MALPPKVRECIKNWATECIRRDGGPDSLIEQTGNGTPADAIIRSLAKVALVHNVPNADQMISIIENNRQEVNQLIGGMLGMM